MLRATEHDLRTHVSRTTPHVGAARPRTHSDQGTPAPAARGAEAPQDDGAEMVVARHRSGRASCPMLTPPLNAPRITLRADDFPAYRAAIIACATAEEKAPCERLLGQIASLARRSTGPRR
jgi:hypothetical protein